MPTDQLTQNYILHFAEQIRQQTKKHQYGDNLAIDAKRLGIPIQQLDEILKIKNSISSMARELFKKSVPEHKRSVQRWNQLEEDVILKEKMLIGRMNNICFSTGIDRNISHVFFLDFLERYFGPLEIDRKKIHNSIVGCLRNERSSQKKKTNLDLSQGTDQNEIEDSFHIDTLFHGDVFDS